MGDNINLGDRDGVRTPMQWSPDRNGGFSQADFASVFLPPSMDPVYGFGARNVESSQRNPASFLQWMRRMIQIRREHPIFGVGGLDLLPATNSAVLAYIRTPESSRQRPILCVANFSASAQPVELGLSGHAGSRPTELLGGVDFPRIGELPYLLTLPPFGFLTFELSRDEPINQ